MLVRSTDERSYAALVDLRSKPKPVDLNWWLSGAAKAEVLASRLFEDEAIYLWLQLPEPSEPRAYLLPWHRATSRPAAMPEPSSAAGLAHAAPGAQVREPGCARLKCHAAR